EADGNFTLGDGFVKPAEKTIGPTQISMRVSGRMERNGLFVEPDRFVELLRHLMLHCRFDQLESAFLIILRGHGRNRYQMEETVSGVACFRLPRHRSVVCWRR